MEEPQNILRILFWQTAICEYLMSSDVHTLLTVLISKFSTISGSNFQATYKLDSITNNLDYWLFTVYNVFLAIKILEKHWQY